jgi:hypothetical protein
VLPQGVVLPDEDGPQGGVADRQLGQALAQPRLVDGAGDVELERLVVRGIRGVTPGVLPQAQLDRGGGADRRAHAEGHEVAAVHRSCHGPLARRGP